MKRTLRTFTLLLPILLGVLATGCSNTDHEATVKFEFELSDAVAKVADSRITYKLLNQDPITEEGKKSISKTFTGSMGEKESGDFLTIIISLRLKDNYQDEIRKMSDSELITFYKGCYYLSDLKVEIDDEPALNTQVGGNYNGVPDDGIITAERVIETLEKHSPKNNPIYSLCGVEITKNGSKWSQTSGWNVWCVE